MDNENKIRLDNETPASMSYLYDMRDQVMLQHGGLCTRVHFDKVEQMDMSAFLTVVVPKLRKETEQLTIIRNSAAGAYTLLLGDQVIRYHVTNIAECGLRKLCEELRKNSSDTELITPNLLQPIIASYKYPGGVTLTVRVDPEKRRYNSSSPVLSVDYYPPPLWFRLSINTAKDLIGMGIAVIKEMHPNWNQVTLGEWPLANVYRSGAVCVGGSVLWASGGVNAERTDGEVMQQAQHSFFTSNFNQDLLDPAGMTQVLGSSFDQLPDAKELEEEMNTQGLQQKSRQLRKLLYVLRDPSGWRKLSYRPLRVAPENFVVGKEV